jgi:ankyrin repeat protein
MVEEPEFEKNITWAAKKGDIALAKELLEKGADIHQKIWVTIDASDAVPGGPLYEAAKRGNKEMVEFLISQGAQVEHERGNYHTSEYSFLTAAVESGDMEMLKLALEKGAKGNIPDGMTKVVELDVASKTKNREAIELLLSKFDYEERDQIVAWAGVGATDKIQELLAKGTIRSWAIDSAMNRALETGQKEVISLLRDHPKLGRGLKAVAVCALGEAQENEFLVKEWIVTEPPKPTWDPDDSCGEIQSWKLRDQRSLLVLACAIFKKTEALKEVFSWGLKWEPKNTWDIWPVCRHANRELLELLEDHGVDMNIETEWGTNVLTPCARSGNIEATRFFIEKPLQTNQPDGFPGSIWHIPAYTALRCGHVEVTKLLLGEGPEKTDDMITLLFNCEEEADTKTEMAAKELLKEFTSKELGDICQAKENSEVIKRTVKRERDKRFAKTLSPTTSNLEM